MIRRLYTSVLAVQYGIWGLYIASLIVMYVLGFFVDTVNIRWFLIPETLVVIVVSVILSIAVLVMFIARPVQSGYQFGVIAALPSILIVGSTLLYILGRLFRV